MRHHHMIITCETSVLYISFSKEKPFQQSMNSYAIVWIVLSVASAFALSGLNICHENGQKRCCKDFKEEDEKCLPCPNGTFGIDCVGGCPIGYYGSGCLLKCNCPKGEVCSPVSGCRNPAMSGLFNSSKTSNSTEDDVTSEKSPLHITLALIGSLVVVLMVVILFMKTHRSKQTTTARSVYPGRILHLYRRFTQMLSRTDRLSNNMERQSEEAPRITEIKKESTTGNCDDNIATELDMSDTVLTTVNSNHLCGLLEGDEYSHGSIRKSNEYNQIHLRIQRISCDSLDTCTENIYEGTTDSSSLKYSDSKKEKHGIELEESGISLHYMPNTESQGMDTCQTDEDDGLSDRVSFEEKIFVESNPCDNDEDIFSDAFECNRVRKGIYSCVVHDNVEADSNNVENVVCYETSHNIQGQLENSP